MQLYRQLVTDFIRTKSISTDKSFQSGIDATVDWLNQQFSAREFKVEVVTGYGNPLVVANYHHDDSLKTILIYGHYDVQPAEMADGWASEPFEVTERDGRLYARGIVDNKGQVLIHIAGVFELIEQGKLKYNVKFLLEGDEESGSEKIDQFLVDKRDLLLADVVMYSDGELIMDHPAIDIGYRGIFNCELTITTSSKDNHSGIYGGSIPNAARVLSNVLSQMHDDNQVLQLPNLDNTLDSVETQILENNKLIPYEDGDFQDVTGAKIRLNADKVNFYSQVGLLTSAEVTTLNSGYMGVGYRNAIAGKAAAKINFRISPQHVTAEVLKSFEEFLKVKMPTYANYTFVVDTSSEPISLPIDNDYIVEAKGLLEDIYAQKAFFALSGAIVPISGLLKESLNVPVISIGLGNQDCNMHGVDENFRIDLIEKGLEFSKRFLGN